MNVSVNNMLKEYVMKEGIKNIAFSWDNTYGWYNNKNINLDIKSAGANTSGGALKMKLYQINNQQKNYTSQLLKTLKKVN